MDALRGLYLRRNPSVRATLSIWANQVFWVGHVAAENILDEAISPRRLCIPRYRRYDAEPAKIVEFDKAYPFHHSNRNALENTIHDPTMGISVCNIDTKARANGSPE